ncbi:MAG: enoyl-CoA hydratase/isomerase family protein [Actinomycetota bacterium]
MGENVHLERDAAAGVAVIRLDRPKVNALSSPMMGEIGEICAEVAADQAIRAVVVTGGRKNFAAGADISEFPTYDEASATEFSTMFNTVLLALENLPQVTISAINGFALGGGLEVAVSTDFRMMADDAKIGVPEIQLGLIPGGGGTQRLSRLAGVTMAKDMVYSGRHVGAEEAKAHGIVSSVHAPDELMDAALAQAARYAKGPAALRMAKRAIMDGLALPLDEAVKVEAAQFGACFATDDCRSGVQSFMENGPGKATFTGS